VPHADLVHADVAELAFPARSFDAVVAFYLFDHLPREEHATLFARVREWLTPDGLSLQRRGRGPTGGRRGVAREADVL
jgi:cyclopropane fatty-acyl-phospholipid synthase-like methyltransferase